MNARERVRNIINREEVDRIAIFDSFWNEARDDFHTQGVPRETTLEEYFDFDIGMIWFEQFFLLPRKIQDETDQYRTVSDDWGTLNKELLHEQTTPGLISFAIEDQESWEHDYKSLLAYQSDRIEWESFTDRYRALLAKNRYAVLSMLILHQTL